VQQQLEELKGNAQKSLWSKAVANAQSAASTFTSKRGALASAVAAQNKAASEPLLALIATRLGALQAVVETTKLEAVIEAQHNAVDALGQLEELMVAKFPFEVPAEFAGLPRLLGRATVEIVITRDPGAEEPKFNVDGVLIDKVVCQMIVDGYNAPLTAGNFLELCSKGFYDGMQVQRADGFVVQTGDPRGIEAADESKSTGYVKDGKLRNIPLELFPSGAKAPVYGSTFDEEGYGGAAATLPFNAYGALGMAREEYSADSASSQWFFLLFDSDLTPAGKNLLDGRYACFGYTVKNPESLRALKAGDVIASTKVISGMDKLVLG
jgi:cyclophilin family peptidyl-prolyl cis-trans isomerase